MLEVHPILQYIDEFIVRKDPKEDYKLVKNIGSGTYGEVYKAINRHTNIYAAIKIVKVDIKEDVKAIAQEIYTLRDCSHQNIVKYFGSYFRKNKLWICMEYCGGQSMQDIYTNIRRPLDETCIAYVTRQTLRGLSYMHKQRKIHRDIKGANILLTEDGQVKIADFGVAGQITDTIQKRKSFIGTPYWMAPEVAAVERKGGYDEKCDIWAVGITAIEYAELQPPMFDLHPMKALSILAMRNYKPPVLQNKYGWSAKFHSFLKLTLNKNEKKRPDADTVLQHEFVANKSLTIALTKGLLHLLKNPGIVPLVPNDDDEEAKLHQRPLEKIQSIKRIDQHSCIDDVRFKIAEVSEAPICEAESTDTIQRKSPNFDDGIKVENIKSTLRSLSIRDEKVEAFSAYNDASPEERTNDYNRVVYDLVTDNQRLRFAHKYKWLTGLNSGDFSSSSDDNSISSPKASTQPHTPSLLLFPSGTLTNQDIQSDAKSDDTPHRSSSIDMKDLSNTYIQESDTIRRISNKDNCIKCFFQVVDKSSNDPEHTCLSLPVHTQNNGISNIDGSNISTPDKKSPEDDSDDLYSINRRKAIGVGLPPTPQVPMGACFSLIFEGCPLKINATATWIHPLSNAQIILFGTNEGIYYLSLDEIADGSLTMLFPRRCLWLYIVRHTMMSLSGQHPQLYNHNLILLFKLKSHSQTINSEKFSKLRKILPRRFLPTTKVPDTKGCLMVSVTRNPYSGAKYLCAALSDEILVMEWFSPVSTFMEVKRVSVDSLPRPLLNFDLLIFPGKSLPMVCLGVYPGDENGQYRFHLLDLNQCDEERDQEVIFCTPPVPDLLTVVKIVQLEYKTVLVAFQNSIVITNLQGQIKNSRGKNSELKFNFVIESVVCLKDSHLVFHQHGLTGRNFKGQLTQEINDVSNIYRLIGCDRNIVVERRSIEEPMNDSSIYILAGHTDNS